MKPLITIAVQCHYFQRRLCWKLSSLAQQTRPDLFVIDVAHMPQNGKPTTEAVCDLFREKVSIKQTRWSDYEKFQRRGYVRSRQLQEARTEWILFADSDMIYAPEYFARLATELEKHPRAAYMLSSGRKTTEISQATTLVNGLVQDSPAHVYEAFYRAIAICLRRTKGARGAGNSQLVNVKHGAHGGHYVLPNRNPDWGWGPRGQDTKSDVRFRGRMRSGGPLVPLPEWFALNVVHLNHNRDKDAQRHIEEQR